MIWKQLAMYSSQAVEAWGYPPWICSDWDIFPLNFKEEEKKTWRKVKLRRVAKSSIGSKQIRLPMSFQGGTPLTPKFLSLWILSFCCYWYSCSYLYNKIDEINAISLIYPHLIRFTRKLCYDHSSLCFSNL